MTDRQMDGGVHNIPIAFKKCGDNFQDFCLIDLTKYKCRCEFELDLSNHSKLG